MRFLCAAFCAAFLPLQTFAGDSQNPDEYEAIRRAAIEQLYKGGNLLVMRHANSPHDQIASIGLTEGCILQAGRGLDAKGFYQARAFGEWIKTSNIPIVKAYTSDMCRAWDTARLVAGGAPVEPHPSQKSTDPAVILGFKRKLFDELRREPGTNILLVNHSNIAPFYGAMVEGTIGEDGIASGVLYVVQTNDWKTIMRVWIKDVPEESFFEVEIIPQRKH